MYFRPLLKPTLWFLPMFSVLVGLGTWQVERLHWKLDLIAKIQKNLSAPPLTLSQILKLPEDRAQYRRLVVEGRFDNAKEAYVFGIDKEGKPAFHVLTPLTLRNGKALLVDRGIVPEEKRDPKTRPEGLLDAQQKIIGIWRTPDPAGIFTPKPDLARRIWYSRDVEAIARSDGVELAAPVVIEADAAPVPGGWPKGGQTVLSLPNNHLQYAITWYLMALGLLAVYLVYHRQKGRLGRSA